MLGVIVLIYPIYGAMKSGWGGFSEKLEKAGEEKARLEGGEIKKARRKFRFPLGAIEGRRAG